MPETTTRRSGKAGAAAAAKALLADRIKLVEDLGEAIDNHERKTAAAEAAKAVEHDAADAVRTAYTAAQTGGWTAAELKSAGLVVPATTRRRGAKASASNDAATELDNGERSSSTAGDAPAAT